MPAETDEKNYINSPLLTSDRKEEIFVKKDENWGLKVFLDKSNSVHADLNALQSKISEVKKLQQDILSLFLDKVSTDLQQHPLVTRHDRLVHDTTNYGVQIRQNIRNLKEMAVEYIRAHNNDKGYKLVAEQQLNNLSEQLSKAVHDFFKCQSDYTDRMNDHLRQNRRQSNSVGERAEDPINESQKQDSYLVCTQNFSEVQGAEQTLREVEERCKDILALEKRVTEVNQLYKEIFLLVAQQGETLDDIELKVDDAQVRIENGTQKVADAKASQRNVRCKKCFIFGIVVTVVVVAVVVIVLVVLKVHKLI
ncbi:hypothetical protein C0Q70_16905 [Pomacea canaliculata]|uniref:t-SNARE coiled-coil homology domain-containing protein n=1 Tax=Pomacea canaliculata TaxID=400727 RepID=A0A2T7NR55_POMCA|nr:putative syntaxin-4 [Pomacea canaliculata]PVD23632.1 hypothetical protein C0Q70_16905 [Pomacea canaliculata]